MQHVQQVAVCQSRSVLGRVKVNQRAACIASGLAAHVIPRVKFALGNASDSKKGVGGFLQTTH